MKIKTPKGMTEQQVIDCIAEVCKNLSHKYKFGYFDSKDIEQEGFIIAVEGLYNYDGSVPLRNFLYIHVANRLKNLKRDNHFRQPTLCKKCRKRKELCDKCQKRQETAKVRQNIMSPTDIDTVKSDNELKMQYSIDYETALDNSLVVELIEDKVPNNMWEDYLRLRDGAYISSARKQKLMGFISDILVENGYKE